MGAVRTPPLVFLGVLPPLGDIFSPAAMPLKVALQKILLDPRFFLFPAPRALTFSGGPGSKKSNKQAILFGED
jgi:hypothetical protein